MPASPGIGVRPVRPTVWFGRFCDVPEFSGMRHESVKLWAGIQRRRSEGDNLASRIKIALAGSVDMRQRLVAGRGQARSPGRGRSQGPYRRRLTDTTSCSAPDRRCRLSALSGAPGRGEHQGKENWRSDSGWRQEPCRLTEKREQEDKIDKIASGQPVEQFGETVARPFCDGSINRTSRFIGRLLAAHGQPIDRDRGCRSAEDGGDSQPDRPERPCRQRPAPAHASKHRHVHDVVAPEIEQAAEARLGEFKPRQLPVAAVDHRMRNEQQPTDGLHPRRGPLEKRAPRQVRSSG